MPLLPTPAEIALALTVLKTKPPEVSVSEYIQQIVSATVLGTREKSVPEPRHIDGTAFWKRAYEQSEEERCKLQKKVSELECQIQGINISSSPPRELAKAKERPKQVRKANTQMKRRKIEPMSDANATSDSADSNAQCLSGGQDRFLRAFYVLRHRLCHEDDNPGDLSSAVKVACRASGEALQAMVPRIHGDPMSTTHQATIDTFCRLLVVTWTSALEATTKIDKATDLSAQCVGGMVYLFQGLLGQIHQICLDEADRIIRLKKEALGRTAGRTPLVVHSQDMARDKCEVCHRMSRAACSMLASLHPQSCAQCPVLEGILCALLDHIGSSLSLFIFANPALTKKNELGVIPPRGLIDAAHLDNPSALAANKLAAPFIIAILRQVKAVLTALTDECRTELLHLDVRKKNHEMLSAAIMERLQTTLLRGVYGDEDLEFTDAFNRCPEPLEVDLDEFFRCIEQEPDTGEWFVGQVWELLGWDVLVATLQ